MRLGILLTAAVAMALTTLPCTAQQITSVEAAGNLKPTHDLGCISMDQVKNEYTPPDLMIADAKCMRDGRYEDSMILFLVAGTYSRFDTLRVADGTSHDAFQVLMANNRPDEKQIAQMQPIMAKYGVPSSPEMAKFCIALKRLGPPNYYPGYMVQHGMGAFFGGGGGTGGLVKSFDTLKAWKETVDKYMHCDVTDMP